MAGRKKGKNGLIGCILEPDDKHEKFRFRYKLPNLKQTQKSYSTREEAEKAQIELTKMINDEEVVYLYNEKAINMTVEEFFDEYSKLVKESERYGAYSTTKTYRGYLNRHFIPVCGKEKMRDINFKIFKPHLISILTGDNKEKTHVTAKTAKEIIYSINHFLKLAEDIYGFPYNEQRREEIKNSLLKIRNKYKFDAVPSENSKFFNDLQPWQYERILQECFIKEDYETDKMNQRKNNYIQAIIFIKETGIRAEELAFTWQDFENGKSTHSLYLNKSIRKKPGSGLIIDEFVKTSSSVRNIEISADALLAIQNMKIYQIENKIQTDLIFCSINGKPIDAANLRQYFKRKAVLTNEWIRLENLYLDYDEQNREIKIDNLGLHSLRKLYAYTKAQEGMDIYELSSIMGHSKTDVTYKNYYQNKDTLLKEWYQKNYKPKEEDKELSYEEIQRIKKMTTVPGFEESHNPVWLALKEIVFLQKITPQTPETKKRIELLSEKIIKATEKVKQENLEIRKKYNYLFHR